MEALFRELKRRNVIRVAAAYTVVAWIVVQVAATVFPMLGIDEAAGKPIVVLAAIGFPVAVLISWFYQWTPGGIMTEEAAEAAGYAKATGFGRQIDFVIIALLVVAVGWLVYERDVGRGTAGNSIAVLPFVNNSGDPGQEYFSDGVAEEILNMLAQVPGLRVTARTSSFQFKGQNLDVPLIGEKLNVSTVLEGSVRKSGDKVRISVQLISTADGFNLWSGTYDRWLDDIFAVQDEISAAIVEELKVHLDLASASAAPTARIATTTEAYELYLRGLYHLNSVFASGQANTNMDAPGRALEFFRRATEIAPDFAPSWVGMARALNWLRMMGKVPRDEATSRMAEYIAKALELGPNLAEVRYVARFISKNPEERLNHIDRAIEINPNYGEAYARRAAVLQRLHRYRESFEAAEISFRLDPLSMWTAGQALEVHFYQGKTVGLEERLEVSLQNQPDANGLAGEAHLRFELGQFDRFPALQRRADTIPGFGVEDWIASAPRHFGDTYLTLGLMDMARQWMMGRYDDAILMSEGRHGEAIEFLKAEFETGKDKLIFSYRWQGDIVASLAEAHLYAGRYEELTAYFDALSSWTWSLFPLPRAPLTNPPWPEVAYVFALFRTGRVEQAQEWLDHMSDELEDRLAQGIDVPNHYYELARIRVIQGRADEAFTAMERAIDMGWRRWYFDLDPILEPIRALPGFAALKARYDADIARMRDIVAAGLAEAPAGAGQ